MVKGSRLSNEERLRRFLGRVDKNGPVPETRPDLGPCWQWCGCMFPNGYGCFGRHDYAHRWSYERLVGEIPDGAELDHLCRNRRCVNPAHLEAVTHRVNTLRGESVFGKNARKTHCVRGHELSGDNISASALVRGERHCAICARERAAERRTRLGDEWRKRHREQERARRKRLKETPNAA